MVLVQLENDSRTEGVSKRRQERKRKKEGPTGVSERPSFIEQGRLGRPRSVWLGPGL